MAIQIKEEQIWTRQSGSGKSKRTFIIKAVTACNEIDTIVTMVDFESNNPVAQHAYIMLEDNSWEYHKNATVVEKWEVKRKIDFYGDDTPTIPRKKRRAKRKFVGNSQATLNEPIKKEAKKAFKKIIKDVKEDAEIIPITPPPHKYPATETKDEEGNPIVWGRFKYYKHGDLTTLGEILYGSKTLAEPLLTSRFKNGYYKLLHQQALDMWRDEETTILDVLLKQPHYVRNEETNQRQPKYRTIQTITRRLFKAIAHFGTFEEKQALFNPYGLKPKNQKA